MDFSSWRIRSEFDLFGQSLAASAAGDYRTAVLTVLRLYGGMGSFNDEVVQNRAGVLLEQKRLAQLREELYHAAVAELR